MTYPIIQPIIYVATRSDDDTTAPPILAPVLSACCAACLAALAPLRLSRRASLRIRLQSRLQALPCRLTDAMRLSFQKRCDVAVAAAMAEAAAERASAAEQVASSTSLPIVRPAPVAPRPSLLSRCHPVATPLRHPPPLLSKLRFDDDCFLCQRKIHSRRGVRLFLDAAFLGPSACSGDGGTHPIPHLPDAIRQRIYELTRCGCQTDSEPG